MIGNKTRRVHLEPAAGHRRSALKTVPLSTARSEFRGKAKTTVALYQCKHGQG